MKYGIVTSMLYERVKSVTYDKHIINVLLNIAIKILYYRSEEGT